MDEELTVEIDIFGSKFWKNKNGQLHRLDGPAEEYADGQKSWYQNGLRHRLDEPAVEGNNGGKEWWINGLLHREDGPAVIYQGGRKRWWYINHVLYKTKEEYFDALSDEAKAKCLFSEDFLNG
jgi:hypothetical protein